MDEAAKHASFLSEPPVRAAPEAVPRSEVYKPDPAPPDRARWRFSGRFHHANPLGTPTAIAWFGFRSFWGHLRHFMASAIATDDVDTRDWMEPTPPPQFAAKIANVLGAEPMHPTLVENLGRDLFVDFVADTGDDGQVSYAVGKLLFAPYRLPDPRDPSREILAERGDLLVHGGDLAYPVGTPNQIQDRLLAPWNAALKTLPDDGRPRVMLGIPGNHDWYDGIDGYARTFRERHFSEEPEARTETTDVSWLDTSLRFVGNLIAGQTMHRAHALVLQGYRTVQRSSYFVLPLLPNLHVYAADRHLRSIDYRQKRFFLEWWNRHPEAARLVVLHDPVLPFGRPSRDGLKVIHSLRLSPQSESHMVLAGDIHHYRRERVGQGIHVTAGGGGAFLHPSPIAADGGHPADVQWPGPKQSRRLLRGVPLHVALGRAGHIPHAVMTAISVPMLGLGGYELGEMGLVLASIVSGLVAAVVMAFLGGVRKGPAWKIALLSVLAGLATGAVPGLVLAIVGRLFAVLSLEANTWFWGAIALVSAVGTGGFVFGSFLAMLTYLGYENTQAFTALAHPGFRHFVRLRVRADQSGVDAWCLGLEDPLDPECKPVVVDAFAWELPGRGELARRLSIPPAARPSD